jgi:hypothetical protein
MRGDKNDVAEATVAVLKSLFGKQDPFFASVQELSSRKVTLLLKTLYGDNMDIMNVLSNLRDENLLKQNVDQYRRKFGDDDLVQFFVNELLGSGNTADKYRQFIIGLRSQLENITSNENLRAIFTGNSDIDLDEHLEKGGILAVNTALGKLGKSGDAFGMFIAMHIQLATFRRPGTERTRVPHYLIIDEYSRYINPDVERFLSIAASYRVALVAACQSLSQLEVESGLLSGKAVKNAILTSTRNKIVFGGLEYDDAFEVSKIMGADQIVERSRSYDGGVLKNILPKMYRDAEVEKVRFPPTLLMDGLPRFHCIAKLLKEGTPQVPVVAKGEWVPNDWKERMLEEESNKWANQSKPPFWKLKDRAFYNVERYEFQNAEKLKAIKQRRLSEVNPFETDTVEGQSVKVENMIVNEFILQPNPFVDLHEKNDLKEGLVDTPGKEVNLENRNEDIESFSFSLVMNREVQTEIPKEHELGQSQIDDRSEIEMLREKEELPGNYIAIPESQLNPNIAEENQDMKKINKINDNLNIPVPEEKDPAGDSEKKKPHASFWGLD